MFDRRNKNPWNEQCYWQISVLISDYLLGIEWRGSKPFNTCSSNCFLKSLFQFALSSEDLWFSYHQDLAGEAPTDSPKRNLCSFGVRQNATSVYFILFLTPVYFKFCFNFFDYEINIKIPPTCIFSCTLSLFLWGCFLI